MPRARRAAPRDFPKVKPKENPEDQPFYFKQVILLLFLHNSNGQQNSPTVEIYLEKIEWET